MYKVILLLEAGGQAAPATLTQHWLQLPWHAIQGAVGPLRHLHNRAIPDAMPIENAPPATMDAIDEFWFEEKAQAHAYFDSAAFRDFWDLYCAGLLSKPPQVLCGEPHLLWERDVAHPVDPVKIITLPNRREGMTAEAFAHHWIHIHSRLALEGSSTKDRLQRLEPCPSDGSNVTRFPPAPFDGAGTIEFSDRRDLRAEFEGDHYRKLMAPDEPRFTDATRSSALMVEPLLVSLPGAS